MARRKNPTLVVLSNPSAPKGIRDAWNRVHWREDFSSETIKVDDIPGVPKHVVSLGAFVGLEVDDGSSEDKGEAMEVRRNTRGGPWVVTDAKCRKLWIVAKRAGDLSRFRSVEGELAAAIYYFPPITSGKHDRRRGYRHVFGEGGKLPKRRWSESWPRMRFVDPRAILLVPPRTHAYRVTDRGIVG